ncbi:MAG: hypothetical protein AAB413_00960 [Patescibacteria group bacterium]
MPDPQLFIPDHALQFRRLPEQFLIIQAMRRTYDDFKSRGYSSVEALYFAYVLQSPNQHAVATAVGGDEFYRRMTEYLRQAQNMVEHVIDRYLRPFAGRLDPHNSVANCLNPIAMLMMATDDLPPGASDLQRRRRVEALRQLAIALQLFAIETADDEAWVADDLATIDRLSWERLFLTDESEYIWVLVEQRTDGENAGTAEKVNIYTRAKDKAARLRKLRRAGRPYKEELLSCRVVEVDGKRFYVYAVNRRKRLLSTLLKLERGRLGTDRRGWKYVVVATQSEPGGILKLTTTQDAEDFNLVTLTRLWNAPLFQEPDSSPPNPDSDSRYQDTKTIGRFHRPDNGRIIAGNAEQLVTTITRYVDTLFARNGVNHYLYRARQIVRYLAPLWFPHRRDLFEGIRDLSLPGYGVAWEKDYFSNQLETWWQSQL